MEKEGREIVGEARHELETRANKANKNLEDHFFWAFLYFGTL